MFYALFLYSEISFVLPMRKKKELALPIKTIAFFDPEADREMWRCYDDEFYITKILPGDLTKHLFRLLKSAGRSNITQAEE